jgi:tRNA pseudouridine55 synthase
VTIFSLDIVDRSGDTVMLDIDCSKGTYVRAIARDLGTALGCGAYLSNLVRTRSGPYGLCDAWSVDELESIDAREQWPSIAEHPDSALGAWPAIVLGEIETTDWQHGRPVAARAEVGQSRARVYDNSGHWRGLAEYDPAGDVWKALRVINPL